MIDGRVFVPFEKSFSRSVFNLPEDKTVLLFISYYLNDKNKGFDELVLCLNELNLTNVVLFVVGIGKTQIETPAEIYYSGAISDPRLLTLAYSAADFYIMPSRQEAFAQTPLEAMACGLPVVAFPCSGTEELINENNGVRAEDFSGNSLKNAIKKALDTSYSRNAIRKDVLTRFGIKNTVEKYSGVYTEVLKG
jgi:glycosyltransferase involved in cell wall biosynthesis